MQIPPNQKNKHTFAISLRVLLFLLFGILTADLASILVLLGLLTLWESAVALFTVLTLSAGTVWTIRTVPQLAKQRNPLRQHVTAVHAGSIREIPRKADPQRRIRLRRGLPRVSI